MDGGKGRVDTSGNRERTFQAKSMGHDHERSSANVDDMRFLACLLSGPPLKPQDKLQPERREQNGCVVIGSKPRKRIVRSETTQRIF